MRTRTVRVTGRSRWKPESAPIPGLRRHRPEANRRGERRCGRRPGASNFERPSSTTWKAGIQNGRRRADPSFPPRQYAGACRQWANESQRGVDPAASRCDRAAVRNRQPGDHGAAREAIKPKTSTCCASGFAFDPRYRRLEATVTVAARRVRERRGAEGRPHPGAGPDERRPTHG
jgi:hypothetical protein